MLRLPKDLIRLLMIKHFKSKDALSCLLVSKRFGQVLTDSEKEDIRIQRVKTRLMQTYVDKLQNHIAAKLARKKSERGSGSDEDAWMICHRCEEPLRSKHWNVHVDRCPGPRRRPLCNICNVPIGLIGGHIRGLCPLELITCKHSKLQTTCNREHFEPCTFMDIRARIEHTHTECRLTCKHCGLQLPTEFAMDHIERGGIYDLLCPALTYPCAWKCGRPLAGNIIRQHEELCCKEPVPCPGGWCQTLITREKLARNIYMGRHHCTKCCDIRAQHRTSNPKSNLGFHVRKVIDGDHLRCIWNCDATFPSTAEGVQEARAHEKKCATSLITCPGGCGRKYKRRQVVSRETGLVYQCDVCPARLLLKVQKGYLPGQQ